MAVEVLKGEFRVTQVVFKPNPGLIENEVYELVIDNLPKYDRKPQLYNELTQKWEKMAFKVLSTVDTSMPVFKSTISEGKKTMAHYGCGPVKWVYFNVSGQDNSELFVRALVKSKLTGQSTEYILAVEDGKVKIGHSMCSGPFHFDTGFNYEVTFSLFDQSGNKSAPAKAILFSAPEMETGNE